MDYDKYLKKDLMTIIILFLIFTGIFVIIYIMDKNTGNLDIAASQLYEILVK
ncbi:hypothetical protein KKC88_06470 [Patescibacteria group bacterium]|nr:hypothetical protein [Patescibacteria group bacterium]MBU1673737.1 hypothetical protein [Patescibacteria group bacterium]